MTDDLHTTSFGERGSRIVFCHGLFGQGRNWTSIGKQLSGEHRITLVDLPHHGRSVWPERFEYADVADRVAGLLSADDPVTLVGHSLGGKVAMLLALRHPSLVERLCVVDVSPITYRHGSEFRGYIDAMQAIDLGALTRRAEADEALRAAVPDPTVRSFLLQNLRHEGDTWRWQANLDVLGRDLPVISDWPEDAIGDRAAYDGPVLWIAGEDSGYVREENLPAMQRWFPRVRRVTIKGAGHWVHAEQPQVFVEVLRRFVEAR